MKEIIGLAVLAWPLTLLVFIGLDFAVTISLAVRYLGLTMTGEVDDVNPTIDGDIITGDRAPLDHDLEADGIQTRYDDLGNLITDPGKPEPDRADTLYDSAANDHIISGGGNDRIDAHRGGDDIIETGAGRDRVFGGAGKDVISGGDDGDILAGQDGDDRLYG
ncbi:MAG: hypothetical protein NUV63_14145, partial [Gallionella sp.]|nr:hypothetical protein [Gallionella sp.]